MRVSIGALSILAAVFLGTGSLEGQELRPDSYRWYFGVQGGSLFYQTQTQDYTALPSAGMHMVVVGKRGGLMLSFEESFGSNEQSAFGVLFTLPDSTFLEQVYDVTFDRVRKYSATMMAWPLRSRVEPYLGVGFGIMHTVGNQVQGTVTTPGEAAIVDEEARNRGSTGFGSFVGGLQYGAGGKVVVYGQYQITTSPAAGSLLIGPSHTVTFGLRFGLGKAKEDIKGGGY
jgi:hypothetical protein